MTNREKFIAIFNQSVDCSTCPIYCTQCDNYNTDAYATCQSGDWWNKEYKKENEQ